MLVRRSLPLPLALSTVGPPIALYTVIAVAVSAAHVAGWHRLEVPALPVSLIAATLGILLGFRNNSGYERWWEARTLWGGVVNQSRTFARQVLTFLPSALPAANDLPGERRAGVAGIVASPLFETALAGAERWSADGFDGAVRDRDGAAHEAVARGSRRRTDDAFRLVALDDTLTELTNLLGGCERIKNTPIPRPYDWLPNVMVRLYLLILPFGMVADLGLATPAVVAVIAGLFLGLDAIGRSVEAPFEGGANDTPMTALCRTIEINLRQMLGERELPPPVQPIAGILY